MCLIETKFNTWNKPLRGWSLHSILLLYWFLLQIFQVWCQLLRMISRLKVRISMRFWLICWSIYSFLIIIPLTFFHLYLFLEATRFVLGSINVISNFIKDSWKLKYIFSVCINNLLITKFYKKAKFFKKKGKNNKQF